MSVNPEIEAKCKEISTNYSACDVSLACNETPSLPTLFFLPTIKFAKKKQKKRIEKETKRAIERTRN